MPAAGGKVISKTTALDVAHLGLDLDRVVSRAEFLVVASFLDVDAGDAEVLFDEVLLNAKRIALLNGLGVSAADAAPLRALTRPLGVGLGDPDALSTLAAAVKQADEFMQLPPPSPVLHPPSSGTSSPSTPLPAHPSSPRRPNAPAPEPVRPGLPSRPYTAATNSAVSTAVAVQTRRVPEATIKAAVDRLVVELNRQSLRPRDAWNWMQSPERIKLAVSEAHRVALHDRYGGMRAEFESFVLTAMTDPPGLPVTAGVASCVDRCKAEVRAIVARCKRDGVKYVDVSWTPSTDAAARQMLYVTGSEPCDDCTVGTPAEWKRLPDCRGVGETSAMALFKDGIAAGDITQGQIGTCWLLGAMGSVAGVSPDRIEKLFVDYDLAVGVFGIRFCLDGEWNYVVIDDFFPVTRSGSLIFAKNGNDPSEVWVPVLEKAFCKLYSCYEMCDGGFPQDAMLAFLDGVYSRLIPSKRDKSDPGGFVKQVVDGHNHGFVMSASFRPISMSTGTVTGTGKCGEDVLSCGLVSGHAYSVVDVVESGGLTLICCRNPWGQGEWTGKYSDGNKYGEWTPALRKACSFAGEKDDGLFWMEASDFVANCDSLKQVRTFGIGWKKVTRWHRFPTSRIEAVANDAYTPKESSELRLAKGEPLEVTVLTCGRSWRKAKTSSGDEGYVLARLLDITGQPRCSQFKMKLEAERGSGGGLLSCVVVLTQSNSRPKRRHHYDGHRKVHIKDTEYSEMELYVVGPDSRILGKERGWARVLWIELELDEAMTYQVFATTTDGSGEEFSVRVYVKGATPRLSGPGNTELAALLEVFSASP